MPAHPPPWRQRLIAMIIMSAAWCAYLVFQPGPPAVLPHHGSLASYAGDYRSPPVSPNSADARPFPAGGAVAAALRPRHRHRRHRHRLASPLSPVTATPLPEPAPPQPAAPPPSGGAQAYALSLVGRAQFACLLPLWNMESGWNPYVENPSGAYGIPQALPGDKMAVAGPDWQTNPITQVRWGVLDYIDPVYGSACNAYAHELADGWY